MTQIKVKATFKGKDGSMGFITGKEYTLKLDAWNLMDNSLSIYDINNMNHYCEYTSFITFLNNWRDVSSVEVKNNQTKIIK